MNWMCFVYSRLCCFRHSKIPPYGMSIVHNVSLSLYLEQMNFIYLSVTIFLETRPLGLWNTCNYITLCYRWAWDSNTWLLKYVCCALLVFQWHSDSRFTLLVLSVQIPRLLSYTSGTDICFYFFKHTFPMTRLLFCFKHILFRRNGLGNHTIRQCPLPNLISFWQYCWLDSNLYLTNQDNELPCTCVGLCCVSAACLFIYFLFIIFFLHFILSVYKLLLLT